MGAMEEVFGEVISTYTRAQGIEDGMLVDLSTGELGQLAREAGFKVPVAVTAAVFGEPAYSPIDEYHPLKPVNPYGLSKYLVEQALPDYARA